jgi:hypothetical protein
VEAAVCRWSTKDIELLLSCALALPAPYCTLRTPSLDNLMP